MDADPLSQHDIENTIEALMRAAQRVTIEVGRRATAAAEADTAYKIKRAKELLAADGTQEVRKAKAEVACADELAAKNTAEGLLLSAREAGLNVRARLAAAQTLAANIRTAVAYPTGQGG